MEFKEKLNLWLVDDDPDLSEAWSEYLGDYFFVSAVFNNSIDALNTLSNEESTSIVTSPNILITDLQMKPIDGLRLTTELRKLKISPEILMISGDCSRVDFEELDALNIFSVIEKPCAPDLIRDTILNWFNTLSHCAQLSEVIDRVLLREPSSELSAWQQNFHVARSSRSGRRLLLNDCLKNIGMLQGFTRNHPELDHQVKQLNSHLELTAYFNPQLR